LTGSRAYYWMTPLATEPMPAQPALQAFGSWLKGRAAGSGVNA